MKKILLLFCVLFLMLTGCQRNMHTPSTPDNDTAVTGAVTVSPLPDDTQIEELNNCTVAVSLQSGDVFMDNAGKPQMHVTVYNYDKYNETDLRQLKVGDIIVIDHENVEITSLTQKNESWIQINGGLDFGGYELELVHTGVGYISGYNDAKSWHEIGEVTLPVSDVFVYVDASDLDSPTATEYSVSYLIEEDFSDYAFLPHNSTIDIKDGHVMALNRVYIP